MGGRNVEIEWGDAKEEAAWALGDYTPDDCPNCGRQRLCQCPNGKTRCETCNWIVEEASTVVSN